MDEEHMGSGLKKDKSLGKCSVALRDHQGRVGSVQKEELACLGAPEPADLLFVSSHPLAQITLFLIMSFRLLLSLYGAET